MFRLVSHGCRDSTRSARTRNSLPHVFQLLPDLGRSPTVPSHIHRASGSLLDPALATEAETEGNSDRYYSATLPPRKRHKESRLSIREAGAELRPESGMTAAAIKPYRSPSARTMTGCTKLRHSYYLRATQAKTSSSMQALAVKIEETNWNVAANSYAYRHSGLLIVNRVRSHQKESQRGGREGP